MAEVLEQPLRVLVVDDDFMVADVHRRLIEREAGFVVVGVAHNARDALVAVRQQPIDLVLLDIYLPDSSGMEFLANVRALRIPLDALVITAARDRETVQEALRLGSIHFLIKPFDADNFRERLIAFREFRKSNNSSMISQRDVDRSLSIIRPTLSDQILPKGLSVVTLGLVVDVLNDVRELNNGHEATEGREMSASEVASEAGISRVSARRYLDHLSERDYVQIRPQYGSAGRPELRYRWKVR